MSISPNILITPNQFLSAAQRIAIIRLASLAQWWCSFLTVLLHLLLLILLMVSSRSVSLILQWVLASQPLPSMVKLTRQCNLPYTSYTTVQYDACISPMLHLVRSAHQKFQTQQSKENPQIFIISHNQSLSNTRQSIHFYDFS